MLQAEAINLTRNDNTLPRRPKISMPFIIAVIALPYTPHRMLYVFVANVFTLCPPIMTFYINVNITPSLLQHSVMLTVSLFQTEKGSTLHAFPCI